MTVLQRDNTPSLSFCRYHLVARRDRLVTPICDQCRCVGPNRSRWSQPTLLCPPCPLTAAVYHQRAAILFLIRNSGREVFRSETTLAFPPHPDRPRKPDDEIRRYSKVKFREVIAGSLVKTCLELPLRRYPRPVPPRAPSPASHHPTSRPRPSRRYTDSSFPFPPPPKPCGT